MFRIIFLAILGFSSYAAAQSIEERVESLEMKGYLEALRFNSILAIRTDMLDRKVGNAKAKKMSTHRLYYALDGSASLSPKLEFYSRMGLTKFFNVVSRPGYQNDTTNILSRSRFEGSDGVQLERAYFNYSLVGESLIFSAGRLPTVDGPPEELYDNLPRQGTYPAYAYGSVLDGFALTYSKDVGRHKFGIRGIYTPLSSIRYDAATSSVNIPARTPTGIEETTAEAPITNVMLEYEWMPQQGLGSLQIIGQQVAFSSLQFSDRVPRGTEAGVFLSNPAFGGNGIGSAIGQSFQGSSLDVSFQSTVLSVEALDVMNTGLNVGLTNVSSKSTSSGYLEKNTGLYTALPTPALQAAAKPAFAAVGVGKGFLTDSSQDEKTGSATIITLSYLIPSQTLNEPTFGVELLSSDQYYQFFDLSGQDLTGFKATRGSATHIWWSQPLDAGFRWRVGYVQQKHKYSKGFLGAPTKSDLVETSMYSNFRLDF